MAAVPWWTEHSPNLMTSGWKLRSQDIDSLWKNVMTSHYTATDSTKRISPTMMPLFEQADSWLMPEGLHTLGLPFSPSSSQSEPLPVSILNHPNLSQYPHDLCTRLAFSGSLLAKGLLTRPLPLPYHMKMDSSSSVYPRLTIQEATTKSPSVTTARSGGTTKQHAPTASATSAQKHTRCLAVPSLTTAAPTTTAGSPLVTQTMGSAQTDIDMTKVRQANCDYCKDLLDHETSVAASF